MNASSAAASARSRLARLPRLPGGPRRQAALAALLVVIVIAAVAALLLATSGGGQGPPPAGRAARLVPAGALVFVHLSTDGSRPGTQRALKLARRLPGFQGQRASLIRRLTAPGCGVDVRALHPKEAALAFLDLGSGTAGSLVLVDAAGATKAPAERTCATVQVARVGGFYAIGQPQAIQAAQQLAQGKGRALADDPGYRRATRALPAGRVADAWVTKAGLERLLVPQGGLLGTLGAIVDQPGLRAAALGLSAAPGGARMTIRYLRAPGSAGKPFAPTLAGELPANAIAYVGMRGVSGAGRLLGLTGTGTAGLAPLLARAGKDLAPLLRLFGGEVALTITPGAQAPVLTLTTRTRDEAAARAALAAAQAPLARLLRAPGAKLPAWHRRGGVVQLRPPGGIELDYGVFGGKVVVSTQAAGVDAVRRAKAPLSGTAEWSKAIGKSPTGVTSLVFLDLTQLLGLAEQSGLSGDRTYLSVRDDLRMVRAVGARTASEGDESTAELFLLIP
jgi:hypothetical protein